MCEPETPARELSRRLMRIIDEQVGYLRGAVAAADAISDLLFDQAEAERRRLLDQPRAALGARGGDGGGGGAVRGPARGAPAGAGAGGRGAAADVVGPCRAPAPRLSGAGIIMNSQLGPPLVGGLLFSCAALPGAGPGSYPGGHQISLLGPPREGRPFFVSGWAIPFVREPPVPLPPEPLEPQLGRPDQGLGDGRVPPDAPAPREVREAIAEQLLGRDDRGLERRKPAGGSGRARRHPMAASCPTSRRIAGYGRPRPARRSRRHV